MSSAEIKILLSLMTQMTWIATGHIGLRVGQNKNLKIRYLYLKRTGIRIKVDFEPIQLENQLLYNFDF